MFSLKPTPSSTVQVVTDVATRRHAEGAVDVKKKKGNCG